LRASRLFWLLRALALAQTHAGSAAVFIDELDAGHSLKSLLGSLFNCPALIVALKRLARLGLGSSGQSLGIRRWVRRSALENAVAAFVAVFDLAKTH
jgi:hypothetical protein